MWRDPIVLSGCVATFSYSGPEESSWTNSGALLQDASLMQFCSVPGHLILDHSRVGDELRIGAGEAGLNDGDWALSDVPNACAQAAAPQHQ